jgi:protein-disulfide isomerase
LLLAAALTIHLALNPASAPANPWDRPEGCRELPSLPTEKGPSDAPVTIIEFTDFECPFCGKATAAIQELLASDPGHVHFILKNNPLSIHPHAFLAHEAALAANEQGKFWEMHDLLFAHQNRLERQDLLDYAKQLNLDVDRFRQALDSHRYAPLIEHDLAEARRLGVAATPTFFVSGKRVLGLQSLDGLKALIYAALEAAAPAGEAADADSAIRKDIPVGPAPVRGPTQAAVTVVEFADFECLYCRQAQPVLQELLRDYPRAVRLVFKSFPSTLIPTLC